MNPPYPNAPRLSPSVRRGSGDRGRSRAARLCKTYNLYYKLGCRVGWQVTQLIYSMKKNLDLISTVSLYTVIYYFLHSMVLFFLTREAGSGRTRTRKACSSFVRTPRGPYTRAEACFVRGSAGASYAAVRAGACASGFLARTSAHGPVEKSIFTSFSAQ